MIRPVDALSPKVLFRGNAKASDLDVNARFEKNLALANAGWVSIGIGAAMTAISRSYTSNWKHAGLIGAGASAIAMTFLAPSFLYKAGIGVYKKPVEADSFISEKKIISETGVIENKKRGFASKIENYSKNLLKKGA